MPRLALLPPAALFGAGLLTVAWLSGPPERVRPHAGPHLPPLLPRAEFLHAAFAAQQHMVADYYWVSTTEATGRAETPEEYRDISDYANLVIDLDPDFAPVYAFAGAVLPVNLGRERWVNTRESTRILERGFQRFPRWIYLRILLGYNLSFYEGQYLRAAKLVEETARMPGAPPYLASLATRLYSHAGAVDSGLLAAESLRDATGDPQARAALERRVNELKLEKELQRVDAAIQAFSARSGRPPAALAELMASGDLREFPLDPLGGVVKIGADGKATSTSVERRLRLYDPREALEQPPGPALPGQPP